MCDTFAVSPTHTSDGAMLFGKNSDRQRNEAQAAEFHPAADHASDSRVACTYIDIPQARRTHAVLLSRPFWMWGAEIGANEHGVAIGNQTIHSRTPPPQDPSLIGMDLVRLGLERAVTAAEAVEVITTLLDRHGQGGDCGHMVPFYYNNAFMVADPTEAFVLETVGREWLVERVQGARPISNCFSIHRSIERSSAGWDGLLRGLGQPGEISQYRPESIADLQREKRGEAQSRLTRAGACFAARERGVGVADAISLLRDHGPTAESEWNPHDPLPYGLCVHAGIDDRSAQTTGAMVSELRRGDSVHWITGTAAPCTSIFKPVMMDVPWPLHDPSPTGAFDDRALWWRHERLHRTALMHDFPAYLADIREERDALEAEFRHRVQAVRAGGSITERSRVIAQCWQEAMAMEARWQARIGSADAINDAAYRAAWTKMNRVAGVD